MQKLNDTNLKKSLAEGIKRLYYIAGNDAFLVDACVGSVFAAAVGKGGEEVLRFAQKSIRDGGFEELFYSYSMLGQKRVAIIEDFNAVSIAAGDRTLLEELIADIPDDLVIIFRQFSDDRRFAMPKKALDIVSLCGDSAAVSVNAKSGFELERYIEHIAKKEDCEIEPPAVKALVLLCGDDLLMISNEIKKLAALSGYTTILARHVEELGVRTAESGVYQMISAIEKGNVRDAAAILKNMLDDLQEPLAITAALNTAFINLYRARVAKDKGRPLSYLYEAFNYKKSDRKVSIAYEQAGRYSTEKLERIIKLLYDLDKKLKSSVVDSRLIVEQNVIELASVVAS